ncbi:MAG: RcnB family protein [Novosphingobium sp.]
MRKSLTAAVAALTALSTVATAMPAMARDHDRDGDERGQWHRGHDRDGRWDRDDRHDRGRHNGWRDHRGRNWAYYGGNYGYDGYDGRWRVGQRFPYYNNQAYVVSDYDYYGLPAPRRGYRYYRDNNGDIVLAAIAGGVIGLIIGSAGR